MSYPTLCPSCLSELPDDYPFDHVAIDLALGARPDLFTSMSRAERGEVLVTGLDRGMSITQLGLRFRSNVSQLNLLLPDERRTALTDGKQELLRRIRELWEQDLNDTEIALRLSKAPGTVNKLRARMHLPSKFGPGGYRKKEVRA